MTTPDPSEPLDVETVPDAGTPAAAPAPYVPPAPSIEDVTGYTAAGVPTFDHIRDKIERRAATADGMQELANAVAPERDPEAALVAREKAAKARLEEIRRSMGR